MFSNWALRSGWRGPIVFFFSAFRLRYRCLRSNWETTWRLTGVPSSVIRAAICRRDRLVHLHLEPHRVAGGVVLEHLEEVGLDRRVDLDQPLASAPFFRTRPVSRSSSPSSSASPCRMVLGSHPRTRGDVLDPAVAQLRGLDGRIPPTIALLERVEEPASSSVRRPRDSRPCHPPLMHPSEPKDRHHTRSEIGKLFPAYSLER